MAIITKEYTGSLEDLDKSHDFKIAAPGRYIVLISNEEFKDEPYKQRAMLKFDVQIVQDCDFKGTIIWDNFNIVNPSPVAERIAYERLARISVIVNGSPFYGRDTKNLHNKLLIADINTEPYKDKDGKDKIKNIIKQYHPLNGEFKDLIVGRNSKVSSKVIEDLNDEVPF